MAFDQTFPSTSTVFSSDDLISKCCELEEESVVAGTAALL